jgi:hypothetical protein
MMLLLTKLAAICAVTAAISVAQTVPAGPDSAEEAYLQWSASQADAIGKSASQNGKVGRGWDGRGLKTERAINFKIRATWFTPEVIRASARHAQLKSRLSDDETRALVREADMEGHTVIMVEIDPNEGSGVIPNDWEAFLQPQGASSRTSQETVRGVETRDLRGLQALQGVQQRNYDYDRFWVVFPLWRTDGKPLFADTAQEAELFVHIRDKEGKVAWRIPDSIRLRTRILRKVN